MPSDYDRRTILIALFGVGGAFLTGSYVMAQLSGRSRQTLRFRHLEAVNESDEDVTLDITVTYAEETERRTVRLAPAGSDGDEDDSRERISGRWISYPETYAVRAERGDDELELELDTAAIAARLDDSVEDWDGDCAHVTIVVTETGALESRVSPSTSC